MASILIENYLVIFATKPSKERENCPSRTKNIYQDRENLQNNSVIMVDYGSFYGEMAERLNALVLKTSKGASPSRVRIPLSPPSPKTITQGKQSNGNAIRRLITQNHPDGIFCLKALMQIFCL